jgi:serine/threonine protein kinase
VSILEHLRKNNIVHRDIKPANLLLNERFQLMLGDFGSAKKVTFNNPSLKLKKVRSALFG